MAFLAAFYYGFPANKMVVIGVTGTTGKSTTVKMIGEILEESGARIGWLSSLSIKVLDKERINPYHMTMLGPRALQKELQDMKKKGIHYAIIEVTSEGIKQHRHLGINFDVLVFTNLAPEHIESHGSFENYKNAKLTVFRELGRSKKKNFAWLDKNPQPKIIVANLDNEHAEDFLKNKADRKYGFSLETIEALPEKTKLLRAESFRMKENGSSFVLDSTHFDIPLLGEFNIYNALAAITTARALKIDFLTAKHALAKIKIVAGRMEKVDNDKGLNVIVDLAHTPDSLKQVYEALRKSYFLVPGLKNMICVFGSAGGIRDKWKRPVLGEIAAEYCDKAFITNEDPYDEDPQKIIKEIAEGFKKKDKELGKDFAIIEDRREAIRAALSSAKKGDLVILTGKGTEATMVLNEGSMPWNERKVTEEEIGKL